MSKDDLVQQRPRGADAAIINDFPNETGAPNHNPDGTGNVDNHDFLTGTNTSGRLIGNDWSATCQDWTSSKTKQESGPTRQKGESYDAEFRSDCVAYAVSFVVDSGTSEHGTATENPNAGGPFDSRRERRSFALGYATAPSASANLGCVHDVDVLAVDIGVINGKAF
jgi:hypothetical protein